ncbi:alpha/beta fold hydrolase [Streptomyces caeni]|uniref:Alpha/beta fold hydrolase n=1 Tax=Streptomyces caeni TaxID=2307231 RepID=A0ABW4IVX1_9ACTN
MLDLLDHLGLREAAFVGHDLGGPWAFEVADRAPRRINGLVVLNTSAYAEPMQPPWKARIVGGPLGPLMLHARGSRPGKSLVHRFFADFTHTGKALDRDITTGHWLPLHEGGIHAFRAFAVELDAMMGEFSRYAAALRRLRVPATVIWGTEDPVLRAQKLVPRFSADLRIPDKDIHLLDQASHFLQEDRPDDVAALIAAFVHERVPQAADRPRHSVSPRAGAAAGNGYGSAP